MAATTSSENFLEVSKNQSEMELETPTLSETPQMAENEIDEVLNAVVNEKGDFENGHRDDGSQEDEDEAPSSGGSKEGSAEPESANKESSPLPTDPAKSDTKPIKKDRRAIKEMAKAAKSAVSDPNKGKSRKEDKNIEHVLKALSSLNTAEEKLAALCKKYTELLDEHRGLQGHYKQQQRTVQVLMREKEQIKNDHTKAILAKSKMENLCRELQKHNKLIKEESVARAKVEEEKRKEVTSKFQTTINDIQKQMNEHYSSNTKLKEENLELANKLKGLIDHYEKREKHMEKICHSNIQMTEEKEQSLKDKQSLLLELEQMTVKQQIMEATEAQLRTQLAMYTEKYEDFQSTLAKSNEVFNTFKGEMDKMTKKIKKLEKETISWKSRCEGSEKSLAEMVDQKTRNDNNVRGLQAKVSKLEKLCRALQAERNDKGATTPNSEGSDREKSPTDEDPPATKVVESSQPVEAVTVELSQQQENTISADSKESVETSQSEQVPLENSQSETTTDALPVETDQSPSTSEDTPTDA